MVHRYFILIKAYNCCNNKISKDILKSLHGKLRYNIKKISAYYKHI